MHEHGTGREIWLWDFAGHTGYRLIHQLFMYETALALLVFNPQSESTDHRFPQSHESGREGIRR